MAIFSRFKVIVLSVLLLVAVFAAIVWLNRHAVAVAYHRAAMNSAYNRLFGNPEPAGNGLASHDVTGVDVDAVLARYTGNRQRLVDLGVFIHLTEELPHFAVTSDESSHGHRSEFVRRMWDEFPGHKHYYLSSDGTFEVWDIAENENRWKEFVDSERNGEDAATPI